MTAAGGWGRVLRNASCDRLLGLAVDSLQRGLLSLPLARLLLPALPPAELIAAVVVAARLPLLLLELAPKVRILLNCTQDKTSTILVALTVHLRRVCVGPF